MIFHCTKALASKLPEVSPKPLTDANPLGSWHAHLHVIDRRQCIMFCHDTTRFVLFESGLKKEQGAIRRQQETSTRQYPGAALVQWRVALAFSPARCSRIALCRTSTGLVSMTLLE